MYYNIVHSCGHTERVSLCGPGSAREWRIQQLEQIPCPDCRAAERAQQSAEDADKARKLELPTLTGSEKQVAWAETIRMQFIRKYEEDYARSVPEYAEYVEDALKETRAKWWIDTRDYLWSDSTMIAVVRKYREMEDDISAPAINEMMLRPPEQKQDVVATIKSVNGSVMAACGCKNDSFSKVVKELGYRWCAQETNWKLNVTISNGTIEDRIAEVGSKLLAAGFAVSVSDEIARQKIISGDYEPVYPRWITNLDDNFLLRWEYGNNDLYKAAKAINGARWNQSKGGVVIPQTQYKAVLDLATSFDFRMSPGAEKLVNFRRTAEQQALLVKPTVKHAESPKSNGIGDILNSSCDVIADLMDDDS